MKSKEPPRNDSKKSKSSWERLVRRALRGDSTASAQLLSSMTSLLDRWFVRLCRNRQEAQDLRQNVLFEILQTNWLESWHPMGGRSFTTYLYVLALHRFYDWHRTPAAREGREHKDVDLFANILRSKSDPERDYLRSRAMAYLEMIRPAHKEVVSKHYREGISQSELAIEYQVPPCTIATRARRGLAELRRFLE